MTKLNDELTQGMVQWEVRYTKVSDQLYQKSLQIKDLMQFKTENQTTEPISECEIKSLKQKIDKLEQCISQKNEELSALNKDLLKKENELKEISKSFDGKLESVQKQKTEFEQVIKEKTETVNDLLHIIEGLKKEHNDSEDLLKRRFEELKEEWAGYEAELEELINEDLINFNKMYRAAEIPLISFPKSN